MAPRTYRSIVLFRRAEAKHETGKVYSEHIMNVFKNTSAHISSMSNGDLRRN